MEETREIAGGGEEAARRVLIVVSAAEPPVESIATISRDPCKNRRKNRRSHGAQLIVILPANSAKLFRAPEALEELASGILNNRAS